MSSQFFIIDMMVLVLFSLPALLIRWRKFFGLRKNYFMSGIGIQEWGEILKRKKTELLLEKDLKKRRSVGRSTGKPSKLECNFYLRPLNFIYGIKLIYIWVT